MNKKIISVVSIILVVAVMCTVLAACNAESVQKKLEKKDYVVTVFTGDDAKSEVGDYEVEWMVNGVKKSLSDPELVTVTKFKKTADAKSVVEEMGDPGHGIVVKRSGKVVYVGTEQGVKDAK